MDEPWGRYAKWVAKSSSRDLSGPGVKPATFTSPALARGFFATSATWEAQVKEASHKKTNTLVFHLNEVPKRVKLCSRVIIVRVWGRQKWGVVQSCKQSFSGYAGRVSVMQDESILELRCMPVRSWVTVLYCLLKIVPRTNVLYGFYHNTKLIKKYRLS